ncbi:MAG TPA: oligosaccharide flippase family protein [Myxococcaceae bacterium]|nr:oligosaccharide flippase family protein [Myxococcaceae bacterium]
MPSDAVTAAPPAPAGTSSGAGLARNALYLLIGQAATLALGFVFNGFVAKIGVEGYGLYFLINSFASFALVLVDWGTQFFGIREVAREPERGGELLGTSLVLRAAGGVLVALPTGIAAWALGYDRRTILYSVAFLAASIPLFVSQSYGMVFRGRDRMDLDAAVSVANRAAGVLLVLLGLFALHRGLGSVIAVQGIAGLVALGLAVWLHRQVATGRLHFSRAAARQLLAGGTAIVAMTVAVYVQPYVDAVLLSKMVPQEALGWYGAAKNFMGQLLAPALIVGTAAYPRLSRASRDPAAFRAEVALAQRPMLWLGGLASVGTWLFADVAIDIFELLAHDRAGQYRQAGIILKVFGLGLFLTFVDILLGTALTALGRARAFAVAKVGNLVLAVGLELLLIPYFQARTGNGGLGVTVAGVLAEVVIFVSVLLLMPRGSVGVAIFLDGARALASALGTFLVLTLLPSVTPWVGIPLCIAVFVVLSAAVGLVRRGDLAVFRAMFRRG